MNILGPVLKRRIALGLSGVVVILTSAYLSPAFAQNPTEPSGLRHAVYSNSSAEIFWQRSTDNTLVIGYDVTINGTSIGTLDATSYYANDYEAGTQYNFSVTAIDTEGNRSTPSLVSFIGGDRETVVEPPVVVPPVTGLEPQPPENLNASIYSKKRSNCFGLGL